MQDIHTSAYQASIYDLPQNIQVGAIRYIFTMSRRNSIPDARSSPRYQPAYLATKYINYKKKKEKKEQTPPLLLHLDNMYSDLKVYKLYCSR